MNWIYILGFAVGMVTKMVGDMTDGLWWLIPLTVGAIVASILKDSKPRSDR